VKHPSEDYLQRAESKGSIRFLPDTTLFQMGRMMHMSLSCVSCGACEDACPMSIPVAQIFSMIADETQGSFDYVSGRDPNESLPLIAYKEEELHEVEDSND
jgi:formate dehydrogenase subunit beta